MLSAAAILFAVPAHATTFQLSIFENSTGDFSGSVEIEQIDENTVLTTFYNTSTVDGPTIKSLYFESGVSDWISDPVWTNTDAPGKKNDDNIEFSQVEKASGPPGGKNIDWAVNHKSDATSYKLSATSPRRSNGLNSGQLLQIAWTFTGDFDMFIADISGGDSRISAHIQNCAGGQSCSAVSSVPIPAAVWLFGSGLLGLAGVARRKRAERGDSMRV